MTADRSTRPGGRERARRLAVIAIVGVLAAIAVTAFLIWIVFFSSTPPPAPSIEEAAGILSASPSPAD